jgi:DNA-binding CsgD family transcriptional regulator
MQVGSALGTSANAGSRSLIVDLHSALDHEGIWRPCRKLIERELPHRSCSLMLNVVDYEPTSAKHHVFQPRKSDYVPATSLTISSPFLERHPNIHLYTFSQILAEDPDANRRRFDQEPDPEWNEFVHLAFWHDARLEAVLSIHRPPECSSISSEERGFLEHLHPMLQAGLWRARKMRDEQPRQIACESVLSGVPIALVFADEHCRLRFATPEGEKQCSRWNRALKDAPGAVDRFRLPIQVGNLMSRFEATAAQADEVRYLKIDHPLVAGLKVTIERSWHFASLRTSPNYILRFHDELSNDPATSLLGGHSKTAFATLQKLSASERRVALLIAKGLSNSEIAKRICRSPRTVEFQLGSIYRKLGLSRRTQLVIALT